MTDSNDNKKRFSLPGKKKGEKPKESISWRGPGKSMIFWVTLALIALMFYSIYSGMGSETAEITYSEFVAEIEAENISEVSFKQTEVEGTLTQPKTFSSTELTKSFSKFKMWSIRAPRHP